MALWLVLLTICLPWLGGLCVWLAGDARPRLSARLAVAFSVAAGVAALALLPLASDQVVLRIPFGSVFGDLTFVPDGLGAVLAAIATVIGSLTVIFSLGYMAGEAQQARYYALVLYFIGAMAGLVLTGSFFFLLVFWEITAFCSYALIAFHNDDPKAVAGGLRALIMTQVGSLGLLAAALAVYVYTGDYQIAPFLAQAPTLPGPLLAALAYGCLAAAAAKSAQVPLHGWLPDAMEAPTPISALIHAATMVNAGVYLLARLAPAFMSVPFWPEATLTVGLVSALLAAGMALVANDLSRVLAYSTISQLGYMVYAVGAGATFAAQFHLLNHAIFKALLFLAAGAIIHALGTRDLHTMGGLARRMPFEHITFLIGALALVGMPPLNGFWSKELILEAGLAGGPLWAYVGMLLGVALTALYTLRCLWLVFYAPAHAAHAHHTPTPAMRGPLALLALGALLSWLGGGRLSGLLAATLPYHPLHAAPLAQIVREVWYAGATWLALGVVGIALLLWLGRAHLPGLGWAAPRLGRLPAGGFGFEALNRGVVNGVQAAARALQTTQTGQLNWNIAGIVAGLIVLLAALVWGA